MAKLTPEQLQLLLDATKVHLAALQSDKVVKAGQSPLEWNDKTRMEATVYLLGGNKPSKAAEKLLRAWKKDNGWD